MKNQLITFFQQCAICVNHTLFALLDVDALLDAGRLCGLDAGEADLGASQEGGGATGAGGAGAAGGGWGAAGDLDCGDVGEY